jgi:hypothetical protein
VRPWDPSRGFLQRLHLGRQAYGTSSRLPLLSDMATVADLQLAVASVTNVHFKGIVNKRGGGVLKSWHLRYFVVGSNFLFEYMTSAVSPCATSAASMPRHSVVRLLVVVYCARVCG